MHVPSDLAQRLTLLARSHGRPAESLLREALGQWMESLPPESAGEPSARMETNHLQWQFVPQPCAFSVYE
jgi:hypothetical protein